MNFYLIVSVITIAFVSFAGGAYFVLDGYASSKREQEAARTFEKGDYAASLTLYNEIKEKDPSNTDAAEKAAEAKKLLIAEDTLKKAEEAAGEGDWLRVKTLLQKSDATLNSSFTFYEKAIDLYIQAASRVKELEERIETELAALKKEAEEEKTRRTEVEEKAEQVEEKLHETIVEKKKREEELQVSLQKTAAEKQEAEEKAEKERFQKFLSEVALYADMLSKGLGYLDDASAEIKEKRDTSALVLINQGKTLFDEVMLRGEDLLNKRTDDAHKDEVRKLLQSASILIDAGRKLGNATFYTEDQANENFINLVNEANERKNTARTLIHEIKTFAGNVR